MDKPSLKHRREYRFDIENAEVTLFSNIPKPRKKYVPLVSHPYHVIIFATDGKIGVPYEGGEYTLGCGEAVIVPKDVNHQLEHYTDDSRNITIAFGFEKKPSFSTNNLYGMLDRLFADGILTLGKDSPARPLIEKCYDTMERGNKYATASAFYELMVALMRIKGLITDDEVAEAVGDSDTARIYTINSFASLYYDTDTSIEDIAEILHLSPRQVNRIVESHFGKTWSTLITEKRMRVAEDLLERSDMSVEEIAEYIGYSSARGFRAAYTKFYGKTPSRRR